MEVVQDELAAGEKAGVDHDPNISCIQRMNIVQPRNTYSVLMYSNQTKEDAMSLHTSGAQLQTPSRTPFRTFGQYVQIWDYSVWVLGDQTRPDQTRAPA